MNHNVLLTVSIKCELSEAVTLRIFLGSRFWNWNVVRKFLRLEVQNFKILAVIVEA